MLPFCIIFEQEALGAQGGRVRGSGAAEKPRPEHERNVEVHV